MIRAAHRPRVAAARLLVFPTLRFTRRRPCRRVPALPHGAGLGPRFPASPNIDPVQCPEPKSAIQKLFDGFKNSHWRRQKRAESPMKTDEIFMTANATRPVGRD
ncbi:hypothetical protein LGM89_05830 [Burkholderia sp. AU31624]|uniref:hypothetical protein n=1 Tax=Burkholderia sp. AU31624 TaxID=2879629 RepID=UPI001CF26E26|nr:hypothetical protein [Burkholderia sp. AU31624]MCA8252774.1 hypothetical protein [Burkholderia sp. AU31624]